MKIDSFRVEWGLEDNLFFGHELVYLYIISIFTTFFSLGSVVDFLHYQRSLRYFEHQESGISPLARADQFTKAKTRNKKRSHCNSQRI